jgi:prepilin-type N-terminal cleavage/methylation domain-containing protein
MTRTCAPRTGFTLIELLVVVTIIVVLIALLTPALEKAVYSAELATCGATIRSLTTGGISYTADNKRLFPSRGDGPWHSVSTKSVSTKFVDNNSGTTLYDIPVQMKPYVGRDNFLDPMAGGVDLDAGLYDPKPPSLYSNYQVYFDWGRPTSHAMTRSMRKLGDLMEFSPPSDANGPYRFRTLIADLDSRRGLPDAIWDVDVYSGHPDKDGRLILFTVENKDNPFVKGIGLPIGKVTTSWWWGFSPPALSVWEIRGLCDYNYGMDDNSVLRFSDVEIDDARCKKLPLTNLEEYNKDRKAQLPAGN